MKKLSANLTTLVIIFTFLVLNVSCAGKGPCTIAGKRCTENSDCCSNDCQLMVSFFKYFSGFCQQPQELLSDLYNNTPSVDVDFLYNTCAYFKENNTKIRDELFKKFNINAAHGTLLPNTITEVVYHNKTAYVTISDRKPRVNGTYLELSEEAAKELGIEEEGLVKCQIIVPFTAKQLFWIYFKLAVYFLPFFILILIIRFYS